MKPTLSADIEKMRVTHGSFASTEADGRNGKFEGWVDWKTAAGNPRRDAVIIVCSDGEGWEHVSVSLRFHPETTPKWELMCAVKDLFWNPEEVVMQLHPRTSEYVNRHWGCLHLWKPSQGEIPTPPKHFVG